MAMPDGALGPLKALATAILIGSASRDTWREDRSASGVPKRHNSSASTGNTANTAMSSALRGGGWKETQRIGLIGMISYFGLDERRRRFWVELGCTGGLVFSAVEVVPLEPADSRVFSSAASQKSNAEPYWRPAVSQSW